MINTILAIDESDNALGGFFTECLADLEEFSKQTWAFTFVKSNALNEASISMIIPREQKFAFLAYSHGSEVELLAGGASPYISENINITLFRGSFFYTCSCSTGRKLGPLLIDNECLSYIGYREKFEIWDFNRRPFVECANFGYKIFAQGEKIENVLLKMKAKYDEEINDYSNDFFGAVHLLANRNALVSFGNQELTIADLRQG